MAKVFSVNDALANHPKRNNFDLTHKVHGSYKMGVLYPFLCKPVVPGDSFRISNECSFRFTPMPFPTQSNMRVIFHYFYVRNKNIWSGFQNWIEDVEPHEPPYIYQPASFYKSSSLADYLDIPSSFHVGSSEVTQDIDFMLSGFPIASYDSKIDYLRLLKDFPVSYFVNRLFVPAPDPVFDIGFEYSRPEDGSVRGYVYYTLCERGTRTPIVVNRPLKTFSARVHTTSSSSDFQTVNQDYSKALLYVDTETKIVSGFQYILSSSSPFELGPLGSIYLSEEEFSRHTYNVYRIFLCDVSCPTPSIMNLVTTPYYYTDSSIVYFLPPSSKDLGDSDVVCPYHGVGDSEDDGKIRVSALPFRAYESIYHAFYRDSHGVQPFMIDGVEQFNKYNTTIGDGRDETSYHLFRRNWELDAYTSCLLSPQQGETPMVGVNTFDVDSLGRMSVELEDGSTASLQLRDLEDGSQGVAYENLNATSDEARQFVLRAASLGFSIPDFRQVNAYQRWKEMNLRKGTRYLDFIFGHHGVKPKYKELDMPEFLGGFTQRVSVNDISNTNGGTSADELGDTLGAIAGQARAIGGSKHGVNHFFDDYGFVVGIMCIVPDNAYDSVLPKHYNLKSPLDMYFPEFSQLSLQPLTHEEFCPIQTINDPRGSSYRDLTKVFGYQRPNHDLVWACDSVHGLFRDASGIGNSVICRRFAARPELGTNFMQIKPEETDTIFNYTFGDEDICLGEIVCHIQAKRPVPYLVVPSIK